MQTLQSFTDVLIQGVHLPALINDRKVQRFTYEAIERMENIDSALRKTAPLINLPQFRPPHVESEEDLRIAVEAWASVREKALQNQDIGELTWEGDIAEASAYEVQKDFGILERNCKVIKKVHRISRPHLRRYPCDIDIPKKGMKIIKALEEAGLASEIRILTGDLIGKSETEVRSFKELTALGTSLGTVDNRAKVALAAGIGTLSSLFAFDPAICIGTKVFYLWEI